jgi:hypothetical protein
MQYWQMRLTLYRESIKDMRETIKQLSMAIVVLFQVAIPAVFMFFLVGLGQLAESGQPISTYMAWLGGYGILIYGVFRFQRHAVLASTVTYWDKSLPVGKYQRVMVVIGLCLLAGNVFLILPLSLAFYLFISHLPQSLSLTGLEQLWPLTLACLWGILAVTLALYRHHFPLATLIVLPLITGWLSWYQPSFFWLALLILSPLFSVLDEQTGRFSQLRIRCFWQLLLAYQLRHWQSLLLKIVLSVLSSWFFASMKIQASEAAKQWIVLCCLFVSSSLAATIQFSLIEFQQHYRYFLSALPVSSALLKRQTCLFIAGVGVLFWLVMAAFIGFSVMTALCWTLFYVLGIWSVVHYQQRFFIPLIVLFVLLGFMSSQAFVSL